MLLQSDDCLRKLRSVRAKDSESRVAEVLIPVLCCCNCGADASGEGLGKAMAGCRWGTGELLGEESCLFLKELSQSEGGLKSGDF